LTFLDKIKEIKTSNKKHSEMLNNHKLKMKNSNFDIPNYSNCFNGIKKTNENSDKNFDNSIKKRNYLDYILKLRMKNDKNFCSNNSKFNLSSKNNINQQTHNSNNDKTNQSTTDDLEKLLQLENDNSFSISELEAI